MTSIVFPKLETLAVWVCFCDNPRCLRTALLITDDNDSDIKKANVGECGIFIFASVQFLYY